MIQASDYFRQFKDSQEITEKIRKNADKLLSKVCTLLSLIPYETKLTSGFRSKKYESKKGRSGNSAHCTGEAIDLYDPDKIIGEWCRANEAYLKQEGLHFEHLSVTHKSDRREGRWCHLTIRPPASGKIEFFP
jgi:hypothetical protein